MRSFRTLNRSPLVINKGRVSSERVMLPHSESLGVPRFPRVAAIVFSSESRSWGWGRTTDRNFGQRFPAICEVLDDTRGAVAPDIG